MVRGLVGLCCFLRQETLLHIVSLRPCIYRKWVPATYCWTSIPSGGGGGGGLAILLVLHEADLLV